MNIRRKYRAAGKDAYSLIEMLVYVAVFVVVVGCAVTTCFDCWNNAKALRRNSDDVARALEIGERWRADIRAANGAAQLTVSDGTEQFRIPSPGGGVIYTAANGEIRRQEGPNAPPIVWLRNVKTSQMQSDPRGSVTAWRWELELKSSRREARMRPLFTFESVAGELSRP